MLRWLTDVDCDGDGGIPLPAAFVRHTFEGGTTKRCGARQEICRKAAELFHARLKDDLRESAERC